MLFFIKIVFLLSFRFEGFGFTINKKERIKMGLLSDSKIKELINEEFISFPRIKQVESFLVALFENGNKKVSLKDISEMFKDANMRSLDHQKKIRCGAFKVKEIFEQIMSKKAMHDCRINLKKISDNEYEISM